MPADGVCVSGAASAEVDGSDNSSAHGRIMFPVLTYRQRALQDTVCIPMSTDDLASPANFAFQALFRGHRSRGNARRCVGGSSRNSRFDLYRLDCFPQSYPSSLLYCCCSLGYIDFFLSARPPCWLELVTESTAALLPCEVKVLMVRGLCAKRWQLRSGNWVLGGAAWRARNLAGPASGPLRSKNLRRDLGALRHVLAEILWSGEEGKKRRTCRRWVLEVLREQTPCTAVLPALKIAPRFAPPRPNTHSTVGYHRFDYLGDSAQTRTVFINLQARATTNVPVRHSSLDCSH